jgi:hypothetical protein
VRNWDISLVLPVDGDEYLLIEILANRFLFFEDGLDIDEVVAG